MRYRDAASFGKRQEFVAIAELLRRGYDVYQTLVDDQQIDCVVRFDGPRRPRYVDVQIKARSRNCSKRNAGTFAAMEIRRPRPGFFFVFYSEHADCYWVVPSLHLVRLARRNKTGANKGRYTVVFTNWSPTRDTVRPRPKFDRYRNNFRLLGDPEVAPASGTR
ncbi:MAG: hypothetical protein JXB32_20220 [Deltaproteobacteria bacterium]|nr:hypothetical protein [Deltaproteobacteria bacterium]